jgi:hypothetical protein
VGETHGRNLVKDEPVAIHYLESALPGAYLGCGNRGDSLADRDTARRHELDRVAGAEAAVAGRDTHGEDTRPRGAQRTLSTCIKYHGSTRLLAVSDPELERCSIEQRRLEASALRSPATIE